MAEALDRVREVAHEIDERVQHALESGGASQRAEAY